MPSFPSRMSAWLPPVITSSPAVPLTVTCEAGSQVANVQPAIEKFVASWMLMECFSPSVPVTANAFDRSPAPN